VPLVGLYGTAGRLTPPTTDEGFTEVLVVQG
jgi:hypothetical protein